MKTNATYYISRNAGKFEKAAGKLAAETARTFSPPLSEDEYEALIILALKLDGVAVNIEQNEAVKRAWHIIIDSPANMMFSHIFSQRVDERFGLLARMIQSLQAAFEADDIESFVRDYDRNKLAQHPVNWNDIIAHQGAIMAEEET